MLVGSRNQLNKFTDDLMINIDGQPVKTVKSTKSSGIIINKKLTWEENKRQ